MRFLPLVLLVLLVPLAFVRSFDAPEGSDVFTATEGSLEPAASLVEVLPSDAAFVLRTADWDAIRERATESQWVRFFGDERIAGLFEGLTAAVPVVPSGDFPTLDEIKAGVHGSAAFFLTPTRRGLGGGLLVEPQGTEGVLSETLEQLANTLKGVATLTRQTHGGVELLRVEMPGEDEVVMAFATNELVGILFGPDAASADVLARGTIDRQRGVEQGGFDESRLFRSVPRAERAPVLAMHLDIQSLADAVKPGWRRGPEAAVLQQIGMADVAWVHARADIDAGEEFEVSLSVHVPPNGLLSALADGFGPLPTEMIDMFPAKSLGVGLVNYDVEGAFDSVEEFLSQNDPQAHQALRAGLQLGGAQLGVNLEEDLIDQFTGRFASFTMRVPESEVSKLWSGQAHTNALAQGGAFFVELHDPSAVAGVLDKILAFSELDTEIEEQPVGDTEIRTIAFEDVFALHWAFTENGLFLSEYESALYAALRQGDDEAAGSAAKVKRFHDGLASLGGVSAASLVETESSVEALLGMAHALNGLVAGFGGIPGLGMLELPDPSMAGEFFAGTLLFSVERESDRLSFRFAAR